VIQARAAAESGQILLNSLSNAVYLLSQGLSVHLPAKLTFSGSWRLDSDAESVQAENKPDRTSGSSQVQIIFRHPNFRANGARCRCVQLAHDQLALMSDATSFRLCPPTPGSRSDDHIALTKAPVVDTLRHVAPTEGTVSPSTCATAGAPPI
jgi:hypothetical protein